MNEGSRLFEQDLAGSVPSVPYFPEQDPARNVPSVPYFPNLVSSENCVILLTQVLATFIIGLQENFCWEKMKTFPDLQIVYRALAEIGLQQHGVQQVNVSSVLNYAPHPIPTGLNVSDFAGQWSDELGRLLEIHSDCCARGRFFIGIACTLAFGGKTKGQYICPNGAQVFPLLGPSELESLENSMEWNVHDDIRRKSVSFDSARKHVGLLGGVVHKPTGSSHYQVRFAGQRTWTLDKNVDPLPDRFLRELREITGHDVSVVRYVLINGSWPDQISRIPAKYL